MELRSTTTLGAAGDDVDDLAAWAAKIKPKSAADAAADGAADAAAGARPSKRRKGAKAAAAGSDDDDDEEEEGGHTAADLQGVKVRHDLENLTEGEAVVLTLADTGTSGVSSCTATAGAAIQLSSSQSRTVSSGRHAAAVRAAAMCAQLGFAWVAPLCVSHSQQGLLHEPLPPCAPCCQCPCSSFILSLLEPSHSALALFSHLSLCLLPPLFPPFLTRLACLQASWMTRGSLLMGPTLWRMHWWWRSAPGAR